MGLQFPSQFYVETSSINQPIGLVTSSVVVADGFRFEGGDSLLLSSSLVPQYWFGPEGAVSLRQYDDYTIEYDIGGVKLHNNSAKLDVYVKRTDDTKPDFGELVASHILTSANHVQFFPPQSILYSPRITGEYKIRFVTYSGQWHIGNVRIVEGNEFGFNPSRFRATIPITGRRNELLEFKVNLYDVNNNLLPIDVISPSVLFDGGTFQIRGTNNRIDGTLIVAPSGSGPILGTSPSGAFIGIKPTPDNELPRPIAPSLLPTYNGPPLVTIYSGSTPFEGSNDGPAVGIQIVDSSGSYLDYNSITGTLTIRGDIYLLPNSQLSQSIVSGGGGSGSLEGIIALAQLQALVSGTLVGQGTYLSGNMIRSPIIAGNTGYFEAQFGVGDVSGGRGIVLTALGYTSSSTPISNSPAIYIGPGRFFHESTPFLVASSSTGPVFSLGNLVAFYKSGSLARMVVSGSIAIETGPPGSGYVDVYTIIRQTATQSLVTMDANLAYSASILSASIAAISSSDVQFTQSIINLSQSIAAQETAYSASQAAYATAISASLIAVSASNSQQNATIINTSQSLAAQAIAFSSSQAAYTTIVSSSLMSVSASNAQQNATIINNSQSLAAQAVAYSASQAQYTTLVSMSLIAVSQSNVAQNATIINNSQSLAAAIVSNSASLAFAIANITNSILDVSTSFEQQFAAQNILDGVNRVIRLPSSGKTLAGLYLESSSIGFWQPHPQGFGNSPSNFPVVINQNGQFRIAASNSWAGGVSGAFTEQIAFASNSLVVQTKNIFVDTPSVQLIGANTTASSANVFKLGVSASSISFVNGQGFYVDGAGNFRIGTSTTSSVSGSYIQFSPGNSLIISASNFFLNSSAGGNSLLISPFEIGLGNPRPTSFNPIGRVGFYTNAAGQVFVGSGSVGPNAGQGSGSWISFGGTDLNIRTEKLFLNTEGLRIQGGSGGPIETNFIALGVNPQNIGLSSGQGFYANGAGNWRVGTSATGSVSSSYFMFNSSIGTVISSSNFFLHASSGGNSLLLSSFEFGLGNPRPTSFNPINRIGFYTNAAGQLFIGSGSVGTHAGRGTGSWISFGGTDLNIRTEKLFLNTPGLQIQGSSTSSLENVIKLGANASNITLVSGSGFYADGGGNFRVGTGISGSNYVIHTADIGMSISSSRFFLEANTLVNPGSRATKLRINPYEIAIGSPAPTSFAPTPNLSSIYIVNHNATQSVTTGWSDTKTIHGTRFYEAADGTAPQGPNVFVMEGTVTALTDQYYEVDTSNTYRLTLVAATTHPGSLFYGIIACYDEQKRIIHPQHYYSPNTSSAFLAADLNSGSVYFTLDDGTNFLDDFNSFIAFNAKHDLSDIPNFTTVQIRTGSKVGNTYSLLQTSSVSYPSGTMVRFHRSAGTYPYPFGSVFPGTSYQTYTGIIRGMVNYPFSDGGSGGSTWFRPGTKYIRPGWLTTANSNVTQSKVDTISFSNETHGATGFYVNSAGQFFVGSGSVSGVAGEGTGSWISFGGTDLNIRTNKLFLNTPGMVVQGSNNTGSANVIKMGPNANAITLVSGSGFYADGDGNFRIGTPATGSVSGSFVQFVPGSSLVVSSSNFFLNSSTGGNSLLISPFEIGVGNPRPTSFNPTGTGRVGFYTNRSGQFFLGSGSVGAIASQGTGSWISFGGTDLNIRTEKLFLHTPGLQIQGSNNIAASNFLKMGPSASLNTLVSGSGVYIDGAGQFRFGTQAFGVSASFIQFVPGSSLIISASNFFLNSDAGGNSLLISPFEIALGNPRPRTFEPTSAEPATGFYANRSGQFFVGSGSAASGQEAGNWISFGGEFVNIRSSAFRLNSGTGLLVDSITGGRISLGSATSLFDGTGVWMTGSGAFRVGGGTNRILFDGSNIHMSSSQFTLSTATLRLTSAGNGAIALGSATSLTTGNGIWMDGGNNFRVGSANAASGSSIRYDGSNIFISSSTFNINTPGLKLDSQQQSIALGSATSLTNGNGVWMQGSAASASFRVGSGTERLVFAGGNLLISSSQFNVSTTANTINIDSTVPKIALGPMATSMTLGSPGIFMNGSGHFSAGDANGFINYNGSRILMSGSNLQLSASVNAFTIAAGRAAVGTTVAPNFILFINGKTETFRVAGTNNISVFNGDIACDGNIGGPGGFGFDSGRPDVHTKQLRVTVFSGSTNVAPSSSFSNGPPSGTPPVGTIHIRY